MKILAKIQVFGLIFILSGCSSMTVQKSRQDMINERLQYLDGREHELIRELEGVKNEKIDLLKQLKGDKRKKPLKITASKPLKKKETAQLDAELSSYMENMRLSMKEDDAKAKELAERKRLAERRLEQMR